MGHCHKVLRAGERWEHGGLSLSLSSLAMSCCSDSVRLTWAQSVPSPPLSNPRAGLDLGPHCPVPLLVGSAPLPPIPSQGSLLLLCSNVTLKQPQFAQTLCINIYAVMQHFSKYKALSEISFKH